MLQSGVFSSRGVLFVVFWRFKPRFNAIFTVFVVVFLFFSQFISNFKTHKKIKGEICRNAAFFLRKIASFTKRRIKHRRDIHTSVQVNNVRISNSQKCSFANMTKALPAGNKNSVLILHRQKTQKLAKRIYASSK